MDRWTDGQTDIDRWMDRQYEELTHAVQRLTDGWTDRQTDWWIDGWIDSYYEELTRGVETEKSQDVRSTSWRCSSSSSLKT